MTDYEAKEYEDVENRPYCPCEAVHYLSEDEKRFFDFFYKREMWYIAVIVAEAIAIAALLITGR